jgi:hypothetical protein
MTLLEKLSDHFMQTLPDSTAQRRETLEEIRASFPRNNETRQKAAYLLELMDNFDRKQLDLFKGDQS